MSFPIPRYNGTFYTAPKGGATFGGEFYSEGFALPVEVAHATMLSLYQEALRLAGASVRQNNAMTGEVERRLNGSSHDRLKANQVIVEALLIVRRNGL